MNLFLALLLLAAVRGPAAADGAYNISDERWIEQCLEASLVYSQPGAVCANVPNPIAPVQTWFGRNSGVRHNKEVFIADREAWEREWRFHRGMGVPVPWVDFRKNVVVAFFRPGFAGDGVVRALFVNRGDRIDAYAAYEATPHSPDDRAERQCAFAIYVLPRPSVPMVVKLRKPGFGSERGFALLTQYPAP